MLSFGSNTLDVRETELTQRKALEICLIAVAIIVISTGVLGLLGVDNPLYSSIELPRLPLLDTNLRFYSGIWLVLGVTMLLTFRHMEQHLILYRVLFGMIMVGGVGRALSILTLGAPPLPIVALMCLEIFASPLLLYWQHWLVSRSGHLEHRDDHAA